MPTARAAVFAQQAQVGSAVVPSRQQDGPDRVGTHGDPRRDGETNRAVASAESEVERDRGQREEGAQRHRPPCVAARVKSSSNDLLCDPGRNRQREQGQDSGNRGGVGSVESAALIDQGDDRFCEQVESGRTDGRQRHAGLQRFEDQRVELVGLSLGPQLGHRRQRGRGDRLADDCDRHQHEAPRVTEVCDGTGLEQRAEPPFVPLVDREKRLTQHERRGDPQVSQEGPIEWVYAQADPNAVACVEQRREKRPENGAGQCTPGESFDRDGREWGEEQSPRR